MIADDLLGDSTLHKEGRKVLRALYRRIETMYQIMPTMIEGTCKFRNAELVVSGPNTQAVAKGGSDYGMRRLHVLCKTCCQGPLLPGPMSIAHFAWPPYSISFSIFCASYALQRTLFAVASSVGLCSWPSSVAGLV